MKAIICEAHNGPESLQLREVPDPIPRPGQALIQIHAAGVNYADAMMRRGLYPRTPDPPHRLGIEGCGIVEAVGDGVTEFKPRDRVMALLRGPDMGGYAEKAVAEVRHMLPLPDALSMEEGGAFPNVFFTAYGCLKLCGNLEAGQTALIHAAGGGVGTAAVQLAKAWGARVIATAGSDEKLAKVRELGADETINYRTEDFTPRVGELTEGRGVDFVLDSVGGETFEKSYRLLAPFGRLITVGIASRTPNTVESPSLLFHAWGVLGFHMNAYDSKPGLLRRALDEMLPLLNGGKIRPIIGHRFPLEDAAEAHRLLESRESYGKILLLPHA